MGKPFLTGNSQLEIQSQLRKLYKQIRNIVSSSAPVDTLAELTGIPDTIIKNGSEKYVNTVKDTFALDKSSAVVVDGITVIATNSGTGRWIRKGNSNIDWITQSAWYIDANNGNDENDGFTSVTALASFAEYKRRVGTPHYLTNTVYITVMSDLPDSDAVNLSAQSTTGSNWLIINGTTSVALVSTVAAYQKDLAANQEQQLAITGFDAAGNEGTLLRFPDLMGPGEDALAWVEKDLGNGVGGLFRVSQPIHEFNWWPGEGDPVATDPVEVLDPLWSMQVKNVGNSSAIKLIESTTGTIVKAGHYTDLVQHCKCTALIFQGNAGGINNAWTSGTVYSEGSVVNLSAGRYNAIDFLGFVERWWSSSPHICGVLTCNGGQIDIGGGLGMFDTWAGYVALILTDGARLTSYHDYIYGDTTDGYAGYNMTIHDGASIQYYAGFEPLVLTFVNCKIDGEIFASDADLPYAGPTGAGVYPLNRAIGVSTVLPQKITSFGTITNTAADMFILPDGTEEADAGGTVPELSYLVSANGVLRNLWIALDQDPTADLTFTIYRVPEGSSASSATALTATVLAGAGPWVASDLTHSLQVKAGDRLVLRHSQGGTGTATKVSATFEIA